MFFTQNNCEYLYVYIVLVFFFTTLSNIMVLDRRKKYLEYTVFQTKLSLLLEGEGQISDGRAVCLYRSRNRGAKG